MLLKIQIILIAALMMSGCALLAPQPLASPVRTVPSELMLSCIPPEVPHDATMGALLESYVENAGRLHVCKARHGALVDFMRAEVR